MKIKTRDHLGQLYLYFVQWLLFYLELHWIAKHLKAKHARFKETALVASIKLEGREGFLYFQDFLLKNQIK